MTDGLPAPLIVDLDEVKRARREIDPAFTNSPLFESAALSKQYGGRVILKLETANPIGSFKGRGGDWLARTADHERPLACASAGNLGQGLAHGARRAGIPLHVFASRSANPLKLARIKDLGASLHLVDGDFDHAKNCAADQAAKEDWRLIVDGEDRRLAEGAATIAAEITDAFADTIDLIFVPVGNGSLACGVATWFKQHSQRTRIVGVSSTVAPATYNAWRSGVLEVGPSFTTIAEGLCARTPVPSAIACLRDTLDDFILLPEDRFLSATAALWRSHGIVAEPSGSAPLAAVASHADLQGATVVVPIGGSNIDIRLLNSTVENFLA